MSGYKNFAIAGTGEIGTPIIEQLLARRIDGTVSTVVVLTRQSKVNEDLKAKGAIFRTVDYSKLDTLTAALQGIDVVIVAVTVTPEALNVQFPLADAARQAGVKLFIPSEFGNRTEGKTGGMWSIKDAVKKYLVKIGLPYAQFFNGAFIDWFLVNHPEHGAFDWPHNKIVIKGTGNTPISWTTQTDVARYVAHVLTSLTPNQLKDTTFAIEGERKTLNEIVGEYQARTGKQLDITYESPEFLEEAVKNHPNDWDNGRIRMLYLVLDKGEAITGTPEEVNKYWPDFNPTKVVDAILAKWGSDQ
ncbi:hypothetical protein EG329_011946 [Mollisiaceae sp. DMI_Dod_QoI]|nr:hypothetical protein EG329_011946 [Helotiales sp. DMI_Dod_QoI]